KVSRTAILKLFDFFSLLSRDFRIGKYPNNCLASGLLRLQLLILPIDMLMGWSWLFPSVSTFVASEYNIFDKSLAPIGKDFSTPFHHVPVFYSLYILSPLYFNNMIFISKYNKYNIIHNRYNYLQFFKI